jgi:hypothetical protein
MATIEELEAQALKQPEKEQDFEPEAQDKDLLEDFWEATSLLAKARTLLDFMSDPELCKGLSRRERDSMSRLAERLNGFLDNVDGVYESEEFEE